MRLSTFLIMATGLALASSAHARDYAFDAAGDHDAAVSRLAGELLADKAVGADDRFRIELVAGHFVEAERSIEALRADQLAGGRDLQQIRANNLQYRIVARANAAITRTGIDEVTAFTRAFDEVIEPLDDQVAALALRMFNVEPYGGLSLILVQPKLEAAVVRDLAAQAGHSTITADAALKLLRDVQIARSYAMIARHAQAAIARDDARRYTIQRDLLVPGADGARICIQTIRPLSARGRLPTLFTFTIYADPLVSISEARRVASHGYAGVIGYTRGKGCSPDPISLREHDGADAAAVIDWIATQSWSDGRVGMYGGSYAGFTQWAVAKYHPKALKALMPAVAMAPGINNPAEGGVANGGSFYWPHYTAEGRDLNGAAFDDSAHYDQLFERWYRSGRPYRDLAAIDGVPNPWFERWLDHPLYDAYWTGMMPAGIDFAGIDIPVLATTGYYDGGLVGSLFYRSEHLRQRPDAEHYLLVGPYDHGSGNRGTMGLLGEHDRSLGGMALDPVALTDLGELRFQWFDYIFRHGPRPALLADKVNFQVMGANIWRHVPTIAAMSKGRTKLYLGGQPGKPGLTSAATSAKHSLIVDLADRSGSLPTETEGVLTSGIDDHNALVFISDPFEQDAELSGLFGAHLNFVTNKRDFDMSIQLYEQLADGRYLRLAWLLQRASLAADRRQRNLLVPGKPTSLDLVSERVTSRRLAPGSRLVAVLAIPKGPEREINMGSGKNVSSESSADAGRPLWIDWSGDSFLDLPLTLSRTNHP